MNGGRLKPALEPTDAFARATIRQAAGSRLRLVHFRGGELTYDTDDQLVLSMGLTANHALDYETGSFRTSVVPLIGRFGLMTPGQRFRIDLHGECRVLQFVLPRGMLEHWLAEDHGVDGRRVEIAWGHTLEDQEISRLLCAAQAAGSEAEQPVLRILASRLFERFSPQAKRPVHSRGGLAAHKLRHVVDLVEDNPARLLSVDDLARAVAISPFHFAHQFRNATGRSPHRFMIERRLSRAVELLDNERLGISEIAARCGFAHTSHLSRHMRRVLGQSPAQLRHAIAL